MARGAQVVVLLGCLLAAVDARAQGRFPTDSPKSEWLTLAPLEWETIFKFDGSLETTESAGQSIDTQEIKFREGLRLRQEGYSLDPRILSFFVELEPTFEQDRFDSEDRTDNVDSIFLNYNLGIRALEGTPGPFSYFGNASRSTGTTLGSLGTRSDFDTRTELIGANWKTRIFPSTLELLQRARDETFRTGLTNVAAKIDQVERTIRFRGRSSKMGVLAEYSLFDDLVQETDRDHTVARLRVTNNYHWGKGSELRTGTDFFKRSEFLPIQRFRSDLYTRLQHTKNLYSTYAYEFFSGEQTASTVRHAGTFTLNHELYQNLFTQYRFRATAEDFDIGTQDEYETNLDFTYRKNIIWGGRLSAGVGAGYRLTDRETTGGLLQVIDESHGVDITRTVILNERLIETATIVVTDVTGTIVFTEGADYTVIPISGSSTQLDIIAGGLINVGDTILVSYEHAARPTQKLFAIPHHYDLTLDFGWVVLFHRDFEEDEKLISGAGGEFLFDERQRSTGIEFRWIRPGLRATAAAERRFTVSGDVESDADVLSQSISYVFSPLLSANFGATESFIETRSRTDTGAQRQIDVASADASVTWRPLPGLSVRPFAGGWIREDRGVSDENFWTAGVDVRWHIGKVDLSARFNHNQRRGSVINPRRESRLMLTIIRRSI